MILRTDRRSIWISATAVDTSEFVSGCQLQALITKNGHDGVYSTIDFSLRFPTFRSRLLIYVGAKQNCVGQVSQPSKIQLGKSCSKGRSCNFRKLENW